MHREGLKVTRLNDSVHMKCTRCMCLLNKVHMWCHVHRYVTSHHKVHMWCDVHRYVTSHHKVHMWCDVHRYVTSHHKVHMWCHVHRYVTSHHKVHMWCDVHRYVTSHHKSLRITLMKKYSFCEENHFSIILYCFILFTFCNLCSKYYFYKKISFLLPIALHMQNKIFCFCWCINIGLAILIVHFLFWIVYYRVSTWEYLHISTRNFLSSGKWILGVKGFKLWHQFCLHWK